MSTFEYVIADVHGENIMLRELVNRCRAHAAWRDADYQIYTLGDYVDRGPDSRAVVEFLMNAQDITCLKGNHEDLMVSALAVPDTVQHWLDVGGARTLMSYDATGISPLDEGWSEVVQKFTSGELVPMDHLKWMNSLPTTLSTRYRLFVHAGFMPGMDIKYQDADTMMWIRNRFLNARSADFPDLNGRYICHGHTPKWAGKPLPEQPEILDWRCNLDCGSTRTGVLRAAVFDADLPGKPLEILSVERMNELDDGSLDA